MRIKRIKPSKCVKAPEPLSCLAPLRRSLLSRMIALSGDEPLCDPFSPESLDALGLPGALELEGLSDVRDFARALQKNTYPIYALIEGRLAAFHRAPQRQNMRRASEWASILSHASLSLGEPFIEKARRSLDRIEPGLFALSCKKTVPADRWPYDACALALSAGNPKTSALRTRQALQAIERSAGADERQRAAKILFRHLAGRILFSSFPSPGARSAHVVFAGIDGALEASEALMESAPALSRPEALAPLLSLASRLQISKPKPLAGSASGLLGSGQSETIPFERLLPRVEAFAEQALAFLDSCAQGARGAIVFERPHDQRQIASLLALAPSKTAQAIVRKAPFLTASREFFLGAAYCAAPVESDELLRRGLGFCPEGPHLTYFFKEHLRAGSFSSARSLRMVSLLARPALLSLEKALLSLFLEMAKARKEKLPPEEISALEMFGASLEALAKTLLRMGFLRRHGRNPELFARSGLLGLGLALSRAQIRSACAQRAKAPRRKPLCL